MPSSQIQLYATVLVVVLFFLTFQLMPHPEMHGAVSTGLPSWFTGINDQEDLGKMGGPADETPQTQPGFQTEVPQTESPTDSPPTEPPPTEPPPTEPPPTNPPPTEAPSTNPPPTNPAATMSPPPPPPPPVKPPKTIKPATRKPLFTEPPKRGLRARYPDRLLPRAIIAGIRKSGSTTLFELLSQHPQVVKGTKELNYFGFHMLTEKEYAESFPLCGTRDFDCEGKISIDGTVACTSVATSPWEILSDFPDMKLIFLFRDPVERAVSAHRMDLRKEEPYIIGNFTESVHRGLPFLREVTTRYDRLEAKGSKQTFMSFVRSNRQWKYHKNLGHSLYYYLLKPFLELFPPENILLLSTKELDENPEALAKRTFRFLGIDEEVGIKYDIQANVAPPGNQVSAQSEELQALEEFYRPFTERFNRLIKQDML